MLTASRSATRHFLGLVCGFLWSLSAAWADTPSKQVEQGAGMPLERTTTEWLLRLHEASRRRAYIGTLVVSSAGTMSSARVWHVCDGEQQMERVETLTGAHRSTFRHNNQVITFMPQQRLAMEERREWLGGFPHLLKSMDAQTDDYYAVRPLGKERVAGLEAEVIELLPKDRLRFGYRIWSEQRTGLVVKLQTLGGQGELLEQMAFSELQLDAPVSMDKLRRMMSDTAGYAVHKRGVEKTSPAAEGWQLRQPVPGFRPLSCYRRPMAMGSAAVQWVFSDGLATVSLFMEVPTEAIQEGVQVMGATHALTRRVPARGGAWRVTLVGEVPVETLQLFAQNLERTH